MTIIGRRGWDRPGYRGGATTFTVRGQAAPRSIAHGSSAWMGLALMVANTGIALVDLYLLAGNIPH